MYNIWLLLSFKNLKVLVNIYKMRENKEHKLQATWKIKSLGIW